MIYDKWWWWWYVLNMMKNGIIYASVWNSDKEHWVWSYHLWSQVQTVKEKDFVTSYLYTFINYRHMESGVKTVHIHILHRKKISFV